MAHHILIILVISSFHSISPGAGAIGTGCALRRGARAEKEHNDNWL
jgi:hypothetical protein